MEEFLKKTFEKLGEISTTVGLKVVYAILILVVGLVLTNIICKKLKNKKKKLLEESVGDFLISALKVVLYTLVIISAALVLGVPGTSFVAILGSAGLAVGLALQGSLTNIAGSIMIIAFKPFKVGDYVDVAGVSGTVEDINLFYTVIATVDNKRITVPNGSASNAVVVNYSAKEQRRVDLEFSVAYGSDTELVKKTILNVANKNELVLKDPEAVCYLIRQDDSAIVFVLRAWCKGTDYWTTYFALNEQVHNGIKAAGIEIPFPQVDVHMK